MSKADDYCHRYCPDLAESTPVCGYDIHRYLGKGAFCTVYSAYNTQQDQFALKIYRAGYTNKDYFDDEVRILRLLGSKENGHVGSSYVMKLLGTFAYLFEPNLNTAAELGKHSSIHPCMLVTLYKASLYDLLQELDVGIGIQNTKLVFKQILTAMDFIHSAGVVHNDLKTDNIMIDVAIDSIPKNQNGRINMQNVKIGITDFNHASEIANIADHTLVGTQAYCAPETMLQMSRTEKSDVWSLGCIFWELLTARDLFDFSDSDESGSSEDNTTNKSGGNKKQSDNNMAEDDDNSDSYEDDSSSYGTFNHDEVYFHLQMIYQILGQPPETVVQGGRDFYNSKGKLKYNPEVKRVDLRRILCEEYSFKKQEADSIQCYLFKMLKYNPAERSSVEDLLVDRFIQ